VWFHCCSTFALAINNKSPGAKRNAEPPIPETATASNRSSVVSGLKGL
jgi:hypothetical protein